MDLLIINGSPRIGGNTSLLVDECAKGAKVSGAHIIRKDICRMDISPCSEEEYENITEDGFSVVDDDMNSLLKLMRKADAVVLASPIYFGSLTAQCKAMIDRAQCVWLSENIYGKKIYPVRKPAAFICVSASDREDFFLNASSIVKHFFSVVNFEYKEDAYFTGLDKKADALKHTQYLEKAYDIGKKLTMLGGKE